MSDPFYTFPSKGDVEDAIKEARREFEASLADQDFTAKKFFKFVFFAIRKPGNPAVNLGKAVVIDIGLTQAQKVGLAVWNQMQNPQLQPPFEYRAFATAPDFPNEEAFRLALAAAGFTAAEIELQLGKGVGAIVFPQWRADP